MAAPSTQAMKDLFDRHPHLDTIARREWKAITDAIDAEASKQRPKPKVFEVHHKIEHAREAFFQAFLAQHSDA